MTHPRLNEGSAQTAATASPAGRPRLSGHDIITALVLGFLFVGTWPLMQAPAGTPLLLPVIAHVSGMLAGYGVLVLLVLVSRLPALERDVGADTLARWHVRGAKAVLGLVLVHAWAAIAAWGQSRREGFALSSWHVVGLPWLPAATVGTAIMIVVAITSIRHARGRIRHERWHGLHLLMYVAVALGFGHQLAGPDLAGHRLLQLGWALAYMHTFALVLRHRFLTPLRQAARHRMRVTEVVPEASDVVSIVVEGQHLDELRAEPGQFFRWRFLTPDHWWNAHPFSLSAPPSRRSLRLTVKALGDSTTSLQSLPVGTWVLAEGPYGSVTSARRTHRDVVLIAGGVGITPMRALFETLPLEPDEDLVLLYRARTAEEVLFRDELDQIARRRGARVVYLVGPDRRLLSMPVLRRIIPDLVRRDVYLCGPPGLSTAVRDMLRAAGLPPDQLHEERFSF